MKNKCQLLVFLGLLAGNGLCAASEKALASPLGTNKGGVSPGTPKKRGNSSTGSSNSGIISNEVTSETGTVEISDPSSGDTSNSEITSASGTGTVEISDPSSGDTSNSEKPDEFLDYISSGHRHFFNYGGVDYYFDRKGENIKYAQARCMAAGYYLADLMPENEVVVRYAIEGMIGFRSKFRVGSYYQDTIGGHGISVEASKTISPSRGSEEEMQRVFMSQGLQGIEDENIPFLCMRGQVLSIYTEQNRRPSKVFSETGNLFLLGEKVSSVGAAINACSKAVKGSELLDLNNQNRKELVSLMTSENIYRVLVHSLGNNTMGGRGIVVQLVWEGCEKENQADREFNRSISKKITLLTYPMEKSECLNAVGRKLSPLERKPKKVDVFCRGTQVFRGHTRTAYTVTQIPRKDLVISKDKQMMLVRRYVKRDDMEIVCSSLNGKPLRITNANKKNADLFIKEKNTQKSVFVKSFLGNMHGGCGVEFTPKRENVVENTQTLYGLEDMRGVILCEPRYKNTDFDENDYPEKVFCGHDCESDDESDETTSDGTSSSGGTTSEVVVSEGTTSETGESDGTTSETSSSDEKMSENLSSNGTTSETSSSDGKMSENLSSNGTTSDPLSSDGKMSENLSSNGTTSDQLSSDGKMSGNLSSNGTTSETLSSEVLSTGS
ncbi:MAG: uncharacterized protein A8A55_1266 [Amphiamblys sp. WSBS2006]|nr:MAG: uncharacterized protein A8A55_1266 [Amphiamblys sp. WSBS2006]